MSSGDWRIGQLEPSTFEQLAAGLAGSELQSLLLQVMQRRAADRKPSELLAQYARDYSGGLRYQIWVTGPDGAALPLVDGGVFDWLAKTAPTAARPMWPPAAAPSSWRCSFASERASARRQRQ